MMFDTDKYYIGALCRNGHDYDGRGLSLRYLSNRGCVNCIREAIRRHYKDNREKYNEAGRKWRENNREKIRKRREKSIKELADQYVKNRIISSLGISTSDITQEMIELKREQLAINRQIRGIRNGNA